jgi:flagellin
LGGIIKLKFGDIEVRYKITQSDIDASNTGRQITNNIVAAISAKNIPNITVRAGIAMQITNTSRNTSLIFSGQTETSRNIPDLADINVETTDKATKSMEMVEGLINHWIQTAADFGSHSRRISMQTTFISNITDTFQSGIGNLVDADMEENAARFIALKVQVQLSTEALSIANKSPQFLYQLFK